MVDVHVIAQANRHLYEPLMTHYHQQRYRVFVEERGWKNLARSNSEEHDQFDDENMVYLLAVDNDVVIGGQRVYPSVLPHMLSEVFPHMAQWPLPRSPDTWECSRYFLMRDRRGRAEIAMLVAIQQFCLEEGIRQLTGLAEMATLSRRLQMGIRMRPLGLPQDIDGESIVAVVADMSREAYEASMKRLGALGARCAPLVRRGLEVGAIGGMAYQFAA